MKDKKILFIILGFVFLIFVFFFVDEKKEDQTEIEVWNINPNRIQYIPPKDHSALYEKFSKDDLLFTKKELGLKKTPIFFINGKNSKTDYVYEGNYNIKNLFSEISIIRTKGLNEPKPESLEKFIIQKEVSPTLKIFDNDKILKEIILGEEDKNSNRYIFTEKYLILVQNFIFQKFTNSHFDLRERNYLRSGEFEFLRANFYKDKLKLTIENQVSTKAGIQVSKWFRVSGGKIRLEPSLGSTIFSNLQSIKADLYPDEENGEGFEIANELTKSETFCIFEVSLTNGTKITIRVFPKVNFKEKFYYPTIKEIDLVGNESISYMKEESLNQLISSFEKIQTATEWSEPKGN